ncbi:hypothetical protein [Vibrio phage BUCT006]|nr:hypothetical protein [Vibrio phage BUCT006]
MTYYHNIGSKALKKDAAARDKIVKRQADRRFLDQLDDFMAAVNGSVQGGLHTKYNRKIASK